MSVDFCVSIKLQGCSLKWTEQYCIGVGGVRGVEGVGGVGGVGESKKVYKSHEKLKIKCGPVCRLDRTIPFHK